MSKSVFISCVYEDSHHIEKIKKWVADDKLGNITITCETKDKRQEGDDAIKEHIKNKIKGAAIIIVLVGRDTHNHHWIHKEVELANSYRKKIICVRVPNTEGALPLILSKYKLVNFDPESIKRYIIEEY